VNSIKTAARNDTKKLFRTKGACSNTLFYILNREFGHTKENEERASDPLAGGIIRKGHQCGMLWGSSLAVGAESFRRNDDRGQAIAIAITATQHIMKSFLKRAKSVNCLDITGCDWNSKLSMVKYFFSGKFLSCFNLADQWAPEAIQSATEGLSHEQTDLPQLPMSCASEVVKKMGATDEEMVMVAGFAGGLGLSGNACGALSAALWMDGLVWCRKHPGKSPPYFNNPSAKKMLEAFDDATDSEILCHKISGKCFKSIDDHTEFIKNGGCDKLIGVLAKP